MKKKIGFALVVVGICTFAYMNNEQRSENVISAVTLANVEALAAGENGDTMRYDCYGYGTVDCPDGSKAELVIKTYSLD